MSSIIKYNPKKISVKITKYDLEIFPGFRESYKISNTTICPPWTMIEMEVLGRIGPSFDSIEFHVIMGPASGARIFEI